MVQTASTMLPLGTKAPDFTLIDVITNKPITLQQARSEIATVIMFICNHCPFVKHINSELVKVANKYQAKNISFLAISSNDISHYPQDAPAEMVKTAQREAYPFPYLFDDTQEVAKAYHAACTPDFFIFDKEKLVYRGQFDDSRPGNNIAVTGADLSQALDALLQGQPVNKVQKPSIGCNIKWK